MPTTEASVRRLGFSEDSPAEIVEMTAEQAMLLEGTKLVSARPLGGGRALVAPRAMVGAVRFGDLQVEVWPKEKVRLSHLLFMLGYAGDPGFLPGDVVAEAYDELWPALAESVARTAERALMHGVLQGYRTVDESSRVLRGRIRVADQLRMRPAQIFPLEVSFDDYQTDIAENQILRTALRRMRGVPGLEPGVIARLSHLDNRLDGVSILRARTPPPTWRPTRLNVRYQSALRLAELVLRNTSAQAGVGGIEVASFVVSMWKVFEDFVTVALQEAIMARGGLARAQYPAWFDEPRADGRSRVTMAVDLVEMRGTRPALVYDAKYKASNSAGYPNADMYQMLAYCTALGVDRAVLVYAEGTAPVERRVASAPVTVTEWPLDLSLEPAALLSAVGQIVDASQLARTSTQSFGAP